MEEKAHQVAELFRLLANENRLLILCALLEADQTVAQLAESVPNISRPALPSTFQRFALRAWYMPSVPGITSCTAWLTSAFDRCFKQ